MKNKIIIFVICIITLVTFIGCESRSPKVIDTDVKQQNVQEKMLQDQNNQVGLPDIKNWNEKKVLKKIIELRDSANLKTYLYNQNLNGKYIYRSMYRIWDTPLYSIY